MSSHSGKMRADTHGVPAPVSSPHAHAPHASHASHAHAAHAGHAQHAPHAQHTPHSSQTQYALPLASSPALFPNASLFNIKSEPSSAGGYDGYPPHSSGHYHSQQHYLHALQVNVTTVISKLK